MKRFQKSTLAALAALTLVVGLSGCVVAQRPGYHGPAYVANSDDWRWHKHHRNGDQRDDDWNNSPWQGNGDQSPYHHH